MRNPIEVVVIRDLVRLAPPATRDRPELAEEFSDDQQRGVDTAVDAVTGRVRRTILLSLATAGRANVAALIARTGLDPSQVSHNLGKLKLMGFVHARREGKQVFYACAPGRVRVDQRPDGLALTVTHASGAAVTVVVPIVALDGCVPAKC